MGIPIKTRRARLSFATRRRRLLAAAAAAVLGGCELLPRDDRWPPRLEPPRPQPPQPEPPRPEPPRPQPPQPRIVAQLYYRDDPNRIQVERAGRPTRVSDGMTLFEHDFVETMSSHARIAFPLGDVWLDVNTRVRVGSLWLFFGRVFASVSSPFSVETEDVTASSEGTKFGVRRDRQKGDYTVVVEEGRVRVTGKRLQFLSVVQASSVLYATRQKIPDPPKLVPLKELQRESGWALRAIRGEKPDLKVPLKVPPTPGAGTPR